MWQHAHPHHSMHFHSFYNNQINNPWVPMTVYWTTLEQKKVWWFFLHYLWNICVLQQRPDVIFCWYYLVPSPIIWSHTDSESETCLGTCIWEHQRGVDTLILWIQLILGRLSVCVGEPLFTTEKKVEVWGGWAT